MSGVDPDLPLVSVAGGSDGQELVYYCRAVGPKEGGYNTELPPDVLDYT